MLPQEIAIFAIKIPWKSFIPGLQSLAKDHPWVVAWILALVIAIVVVVAIAGYLYDSGALSKILGEDTQKATKGTRTGNVKQQKTIYSSEKPEKQETPEKRQHSAEDLRAAIAAARAKNRNMMRSE
jgi:hypothetical protein